MNILGVNVPAWREKRSEFCHELTIRYSLAKVGRNDAFLLDSGDFAKFLSRPTTTTTTKQPGVIATFWERDNLFHSMIVGMDDKHWIGSNNLNTFQMPGNRIEVDVSKFLCGTDNIRLKIAGNTNDVLYSIKYYTPQTIAGYVPEPEPGCCC